MDPNIQHLGFFHLSRAHITNPVRSLRIQLLKRRRDDLTRTLLVLPEAFNIREQYIFWPRGSSVRKPDSSTRNHLRKLSTKFKVAFVVSLIEADIPSGQRGYNSAYLIDGPVVKLLSRKMLCDGSSRYSPHPPFLDTAIKHRGACISSLICRDATEDMNDPRIDSFFDAVIARMAAKRMARNLMCIPARTTRYDGVQLTGKWCSRLLEKGMLSPCAIFANADSKPSALSMEGLVLTTPWNAERDEIKIAFNRKLGRRKKS